MPLIYLVIDQITGEGVDKCGLLRQVDQVYTNF